MRKRVLALALTLVMGVSVLAGCSGGEKSESKPKKSATADKGGSQVAKDEGMWADYEVDLTNNLCNPNATDKAKATYNWLRDIKGKYIITGLQEQCADSKNLEFKYLKDTVEDFPGLRGLDFISGDYEGVTTRSIMWSKQNMLISICWHMGVPGHIDGGYNSSKETVEGLAEAMDDPNSELYKQIVEDIDKAVPYLQKLQDNNVVVLWRPFHEFNGRWFWWGKAGSETFVKLWRLMYDRYTNVHGLNNLIWVLGYSGSNVKAADKWYPGDDCVDIIGADTYSDDLAASGYAPMYNELAGMETSKNANKPYALHECGKAPAAGELQGNKADWLWFLLWHSDYVRNEAHNSPNYLLINFTSDYYLNLSEMPNFNAKLGISTR